MWILKEVVISKKYNSFETINQKNMRTDKI